MVEGRRREAPFAKAMGVWQRGMVGCAVQGVTRWPRADGRQEGDPCKCLLPQHAASKGSLVGANWKAA